MPSKVTIVYAEVPISRKYLVVCLLVRSGRKIPHFAIHVHIPLLRLLNNFLSWPWSLLAFALLILTSIPLRVGVNEQPGGCVVAPSTAGQVRCMEIVRTAVLASDPLHFWNVFSWECSKTRVIFPSHFPWA